MKQFSPWLAAVDAARRLKLSRQRFHLMVKRYGIVLTPIGNGSYLTEADMKLLLARQRANHRAMAQKKNRDRG